MHRFAAFTWCLACRLQQEPIPRVHVPYHYILGPHSPYIGSSLMPKYSLFGYMESSGRRKTCGWNLRSFWGQASSSSWFMVENLRAMSRCIYLGENFSGVVDGQRSLGGKSARGKVDGTRAAPCGRPFREEVRGPLSLDFRCALAV